MKVKKVNILGKDVLHVYLHKDEETNSNIIADINEMKQQNQNVVLFVSGNEDIKSTLQYIINKQAIQTV